MTEAETTRFYLALGDRVAEARLALDMSQQELAETTGFVRASIANIETGRQRLPIHKAIEIAAALSVDPKWLVFGEGSGPQMSDVVRDRLRERLERAEQEIVRIKAVLGS